MHEQCNEQESHPARYFVAQRGCEQMPLRLPTIHLDGNILHCDTSTLELQGLALRVMREFILRSGRLPHVVLLQLVKRSAMPDIVTDDSADRQATEVISYLRSRCAASFSCTHPHLCWLPSRASKGENYTWLLAHLKEGYVLAHMHERGRIANLFHRHEFNYAPMS